MMVNLNGKSDSEIDSGESEGVTAVAEPATEATLRESLDEMDEKAEAEPEAEPESKPAPPPLDKILAEMADAEQKCQEAEIGVEVKKADLKDAKTEYDGCVLKLRKLARALRNDQDRPLFDGMEGQAEGFEDAAAEEDDSDCLTELIDVLNLPAGIVAKLEDERISTVGDLENLRSEITLGRKEWPKGIGPAKVDVIETTVVEWIAANYIETEVNDDGEEEAEE